MSEVRLVKDSCGLESFKVAIESANNLITTLRTYIQGHVSLSEASPSPPKLLPRRPTTQSRPPRKKMTRISESESSSSLDYEDDRTTREAELSSSILSTKQHKIRREIIQIKLVKERTSFQSSYRWGRARPSMRKITQQQSVLKKNLRIGDARQNTHTKRERERGTKNISY